jgi:hypothetical protein
VSARLYQQVNLYQPIFRRQRQIFSAATMLEAAAVFAVSLLAIHAYGLWKVSGLEAEAVQLEGREKAYAAQIGRFDASSGTDTRREMEQELKKLNAERLAQQRLIEILETRPLGSTDGFSGYLGALARRHTNGLWLTELRINGASRAIELVGRTTKPDLVPQYLLSLGEEEALSGQRFDALQIERAENGGDISFRVSSRAVEESGPEAVARR